MPSFLAKWSLERFFCRRDAPKGDLKTIFRGRDRKSETIMRKKCPQKRPSCLRAVSCGFRKTAYQGSNLGPAD